MSTPPEEPVPPGPPDDEPAAERAGPADAPAPAKPTLRARADELRVRTEQTKQTLGARAGELEARHATVRVALAAYRRDRRQAGGLLAGGLAFRLFLWLLPTALAVASTLRLLSDATTTSPEAMAEDVGLGAAMTAAVAAAARDSGRGAPALLVLGVALMLWAASGMVKGLRLLAAVTWQIQPVQHKGALRWAAGFSGVALGVLVLPLLLEPLYRGGLVSDVIASLLSIAVLAALTVWVMGRLPHPPEVGWVDLLPGAILVGLGAEIVRLVTAVYLAPRLGRTEDLYGALGLAAVFLTWLYLAGRILVGGFALNAERWRARRPAADDRGDAAGP